MSAPRPGLTPCRICAGTGGSPLPHLRRDLLRYPDATLPTMSSLGEALSLVMCALGSLVPDGVVTHPVAKDP